MSNPADAIMPLPPHIERLLDQVRQDPPLAAEIQEELYDRVAATVDLHCAAAEEPSQPVAFGKYHLLERINVGGMAEVFKAKTCGVEGFERFVAVKRILPAIAEDREFISMFIDEAKIAVRLNHANIAQIFDLGSVDERYFITLEYVFGKDLRAIFDRCLEQGEPMPVPQAAYVIMKVCEGLDYAHGKRDSSGAMLNLVHRDVSLQNVMVSYDGEIKLVDFGIAKAAGRASGTQAGILKGKFGYMSPEQVRGLPVDRRSDIFAVGICLYELITGERLFRGASDFSTLEKVRNVEILPPTTFNRRIPEELEQIMLRALEGDADERYPSAVDLHDDLQAFLYSSGNFCSRKDLASWIRGAFAEELRREQRKHERQRQLPVSSDTALPEVPPLPPITGGGGLSLEGLSRDLAGLDLAPRDADPPPSLTWDDDEVDTHVFDTPGPGGSSSRVALKVHEPEELPVPSLPDSTPEAAGRGASPESLAPLLALRPSTPQPPAAEGTPLPVIPAAPARRRRSLGVWLMVLLLAAVCCGAALGVMLLPPRAGTIQIRSASSDVTVYLDGKQQPGMIMTGLKPGFYIVSVHRPGHQRWQKSMVVVRSGETAVLVPRMLPLADAVIRLGSNVTGAEVYLDGKRLRHRTPLRIRRVTEGRHRLEVRKPPLLPWVHNFEIKSRQVLDLYCRLDPPQSGPTAVASLVKPKASRTIPRPRPRRPLKVAARRPPPPKVARRPGKADPVPSPGPRKLTPRPVSKAMLRAVPIKDAPAYGFLLVGSKPWTSIWINGLKTDYTTPRKLTLRPGPYRITLRNPRFDIDWSFRVNIKAGQTIKRVQRFHINLK